MTTELGLRWAQVDPSGPRVRDLPLRKGDSFFDNLLDVGSVTDNGFESYVFEALARDELRDRCSEEEEDSDDDDTGLELSLEANFAFDIFGGLFL